MSRFWFAIGAIGALLFTGCDGGHVEHWNDDERITKFVKIDGTFSLWCDKSTNIVYLVGIEGQRAAITAYLNSDGQPTRCNELHR